MMENIEIVLRMDQIETAVEEYVGKRWFGNWTVMKSKPFPSREPREFRFQLEKSVDED